MTQPLVGQTFGFIGRAIKHPEPATTVRQQSFHSASVVSVGWQGRIAQSLLTSPAGSSSIVPLIALVAAMAAIDPKASSLGWVAAPQGDVEEVPGGYRQQFTNADIYVGSSGVAFEVHGDIRAKYNALGGPAGTWDCR
jgi:LGFP repeat